MPTARLLCAMLIWVLAAALCAGEAVKLEYKLQPGTEAKYSVTGTLKQGEGDAQGGGKITGSLRNLVCEFDAKTGFALIGTLGSMTAEIKQGNNQRKDTQHVMQAFRTDRSGKALPRKKAEKEDEKKRNRFAEMILKQLEGRTHTLPEAAVKAGDKWEANDACLGIPIAAQSSFTLTEMKPIDGRQHAVIKSTGKLSAGDENIPGFEGKTEGEALFDIDRGVFTQLSTKMEMSFPGGGMSMEMTMKLESYATVNAGVLAADCARFKKVDLAIGKFYENEADKAVEELEALRTAEKDKDWQDGLDSLLALGRQIQRFSTNAPAVDDAGEEEAPKTPQAKLMHEATTLAGKGQFKEAVAKFRELAEKHPNDELAPAALMAAAELCEKNLNDKAAAQECRKALVALREKSAGKDAAKDPLELYKLASTCAEAGDLPKAADAYRKFLASDAKDSKMRVLAQYRLAGVLEKLKQPREALAAYQAVEKIESDDDYAKQIKEKSKQKAAELEKAK